MRRFFSTLGAAAVVTSLLLPAIAQPDRRRSTTFAQADNGRLVVACDMRSDACSDGRQITTERATPVPCETSPGVWEIVPEDVGCYSVRGLESWAANTSYLSWGAELDRSPWQVTAGTSIAPLPDGGYRVCQDTGTSGIRQYAGDHITQGETFTLAGLLRANTAPRVLVGLGGVFDNNVALPAQWGRVSHGGAFTSGTAWASFFPRPSGPGQCIDILAAWLTKTDTPGRACWGGEAPVTCAADRHTISTEGWPTEEGEISIAFTMYEPCTAGATCFIFDGRLSAQALAPHIFVQNELLVLGGWGLSSTPIGPPPQAGVPERITLRRDGATVEVARNGSVVFSAARDPFPWGASATLGLRYAAGGSFRALNGSISSLRIRSYE